MVRKILAGIAAGLLQGWYFLRKLRRGEKAERRAAGLEGWIKSDAEAERQQKEVGEAVKDVLARPNDDPLDF